MQENRSGQQMGGDRGMPAKQDPGADPARSTGSPLGNRGKEPVTQPRLAETVQPPPVASPPAEPWGRRGKEPVTQPRLAGTAQPPPVTRPPVTRPPAEPVRHEEVIRYGPGLPTTQEAATAAAADQVWRTGRLPRQPQRRARLPRWLGSALTVVLLAASGVVLYLRFHHGPFHVTGIVISQQAHTGCGVDVNGMISTNGAAGTVAYQWRFIPDRHAPRRLSQSVIAGQRTVIVTVTVEGTGHGGAFRKVVLQVLGPNRVSASATVSLSCR